MSESASSMASSSSTTKSSNIRPKDPIHNNVSERDFTIENSKDLKNMLSIMQILTDPKADHIQYAILTGIILIAK